MKLGRIILPVVTLILFLGSCSRQKKKAFTGADGEVSLVVLDPGHFHASLLQKNS